MAPCLDGSDSHQCVFDDIQCLFICEACGAVVSRDESVFEVNFLDGIPTSSRVHDADNSAEGVSAATMVSQLETCVSLALEALQPMPQLAAADAGLDYNLWMTT